MISLSALINVKIPIHLHIYLSICIVFSQMDIFSGEDLYDMILEFKEVAPPSEHFAFFGVDSSNFILNSGSYFVIQGGLLIYFLTLKIINTICVKYA